MNKEIPWYEWRYTISEEWDVTSLLTKKKFMYNWEIVLWYIVRSSYVDKNWYPRISLRDSKWISRWHWIYQLVMLTYKWPYPSSIHQINHKDWNKLNSSLPNLEYVLPIENSNKKNPENIMPKWDKHWWYGKKWKLSKLSKRVWQFKDWILVAEYDWLSECSRITWFNPSNIWCVIHKTRQSTCHWYTFEYI